VVQHALPNLAKSFILHHPMRLRGVLHEPMRLCRLVQCMNEAVV
jgi:hypothetical protein